MATSQGLEDAGSTGSGSRSGRLTVRAPGGTSPETPRTQTSGLQRPEHRLLCLQPLVSGGSVLKSLPAKEEVWAQFLGWEDPLKRGTATHCSLLARRIPWTEEPGGLQSMGGVAESQTRLHD